MKRKKGRKGWVAIKVDLEKAYDRVQWSFLQTVLESFNFSQSWIKLIQISPYLFVLCMEKLTCKATETHRDIMM